MNKTKTWFVPHEFKYKEIPPILLGKTEFEYETDGFYHTGQYYLIQEDIWDSNDPESVRIHIIEFDQVSAKFVRKIVQIKPKFWTESTLVIEDHSFQFYPESAMLLHVYERCHSDTEFFVDIYCYYVVDWFEKHRGSNDLVIGPKDSSKIRLMYNKQEFNQVKRKRSKK